MLSSARSALVETCAIGTAAVIDTNVAISGISQTNVTPSPFAMAAMRSPSMGTALPSRSRNVSAL